MFIDPGIHDWEKLAHSDGINAEVVLLDGHGEAIAQIAGALHGRTQLRAIHILSHGRAGEVVFSQGVLSMDNLHRYRRQLQAIASALDTDGSIFFYGCNVAKSRSGKRFLGALAGITNRGIRASEDPTGNLAMGGDWQFEASVGAIVSSTLPVAFAHCGFNGLLLTSGEKNFSGATDDGDTVTTADSNFIASTATSGGMNLDSDELYINSSTVSAATHSFTVATTATALPAVFELDALNLTEYTAGAGRQFSGDIVITGNNPSGTNPTYDYPVSSLPADFRASAGAHTINLNGTDFDGVDIDAFTISYTPNSQQPNELGLLTFSITVTPISSPPVMANLDGDSAVYAAGNGAIAIDRGTQALVTDADSADFDGGTLRVRFAGGTDTSEDLLSLDTGGSVSLSGTAAGSTVSVSGSAVGTLVNDIAKGADLTINLTAGATPGNTTPLVRAVTYENTDTINPTPGARTIEASLTDGDGGESTLATVAVTVNAPGHRNFEGATSSGGIVTSQDGDFDVSTPNTGGMTHSSYATLLDEVYINDSTETTDTQSITVATSVTASLATFELDAVTVSDYPAGEGSQFSGNIVITGSNPAGADPSYSFSAASLPADCTTQAGGYAFDLNGTAFDGIAIDAFTVTFTPTSQQPNALAVMAFLIGSVATSDAPVLSNLDGDSLGYANGDGAVTIDQGSSVTVTDTDSIDFDGGAMTVRTASGPDVAEDRLSLDTGGTVALGGTTAGSNVSVGGTSIGALGNDIGPGTDLIVNLNASATPSTAATLIAAVTYENVDTINPTPGARTIEVVVTDGDGGASSPAGVTLTVVMPGHRNFEGAVDVGDTVTSADGHFIISTPNTTGMAHGAYSTYLDEVYITDGTATTATQTISVAATAAAPSTTFELDAITLSEFTAGAADDFTGDIVITGNNPVGTNPSHSVTASDLPADLRTHVGGYTLNLNGTAFDGVAIDGFSIEFTPDSQPPYEFAIVNFLMVDAVPNLPPSLSDLHGDAFTYNEGDGAVVMDQGTSAGVADADSTDFDGGRLTVNISAGLDASEDRLSLDTSGTVALTGTAMGSTVTIGGTAIGTLGATIATGADLIVNLNANADPSALTTLVGTITYENTNTADPSAGSRTIDTYLSDGDGGTSTTASVTATVVAVNDPPAVGTNTGSTVNEGAVDNITAAELNEGDPDDAGPGITYTVSATVANGTLFNDVNGNGLADDASEQLANGETFSQSDIDAGQLKYLHDGSETLLDGFSFSLADGGEDGATALTGQSFSITVSAINDAPLIGGLDGDATTVAAGGPAGPIDDGSNATVSDVDSSDMTGGLLSVAQTSGTANGSFAVNGTTVTAGGDDAIAAAESIAVNATVIGSVHAVNDGQGGNDLTINFTADATLDRVQALIRNLGYAAPSGIGNRTFTLTVNDGDGGNSPVCNLTISVTPSPPVITNLDGDTSQAFLPDGPVGMDAGGDAAVSDPDSAHFDTGRLTVTQTGGTTDGDISVDGTTVTAGGDAGIAAGESIVVSGTDIGGVDALNDGQNGNNLEIVLNANATPARVESLIHTLHYDAPTIGTRAFTIGLDDGSGAPSADSTVSLTLVVNTPPTAADGSISLAAGRAYTFVVSNFQFSDADVGDALQHLRLSPHSAAGQLTLSGTAVTAGQIISAGEISAGSLAFSSSMGSGTYAFTFEVHDGRDFSLSAYTLTIQVQPPAPTPEPPNDDNQLDDGDTVPAGSHAVNSGHTVVDIVVETGGSVINSGTISQLVNAGTVNGGVVGGVSVNSGELDGVTLAADAVLDNRGGIVRDAVNNGTIHGGFLSGDMLNHGTVSGSAPDNADTLDHLLTTEPECTLTGGTITGTVIHYGIFSDVTLAAGTRIHIPMQNGDTGHGILQGTIEMMGDDHQSMTLHIPVGTQCPDDRTVGADIAFQWLRTYARAHGWDMTLPPETEAPMGQPADTDTLSGLPDAYILVDGVIISPGGMTSDAAVSLEFPCRQAYLPDGYQPSDLQLLGFDPSDGTWKHVACEMDADLNVHVATDLLTAYALVLPREDAVQAGVRVDAAVATTGENGDTATFTLELTRQPIADVIVMLSVSDAGEARIEPDLLTFLPHSYTTPQTITLTGLDDHLIDGDVRYSVMIHPLISADPSYDAVDPPDLITVNLDNDIPQLTAPTEAASEVGLTTQLAIAPIGTGDPAFVHTRTRWQVALAPAFADADMVLDLTSATNPETLTIAPLILEPGTTYFWRASVISTDGSRSSWSNPGRFTTVSSNPEDMDGNGIPDGQQLYDATDLDRNGVPDSDQVNFKRIAAVSGNCHIAIQGGTNTISVWSVASIDPDTIADMSNRPDRLDIGLVGFKILVAEPGASAQVTLHLSRAVSEESMWHKYHPISGWLDFSDAVTLSFDRMEATIRLTDGGAGDADGVANGIIIDPLGPDLLAADDAPTTPPSTTAGGDGGGGCFIRVTASSQTNNGLWGLGLPATVVLLCLPMLVVLSRRCRW